MTTSTGLLAFAILCRCGNELDTLREACVPGSDGWVGLTQMTGVIDTLIDTLVYSDGLDEDEEE